MPIKNDMTAKNELHGLALSFRGAPVNNNLANVMDAIADTLDASDREDWKYKITTLRDQLITAAANLTSFIQLWNTEPELLIHNPETEHLY